MNYELNNGKLTVTISDLGAELTKVVDKTGYNYMWSGKRWGGRAPLLFPICSDTFERKYTYQGKEYALDHHGFARNSVFTVTEKTDSYIKFELKASTETKKVYPFDFTLTAEYKLFENELTANFTVTNKNGSVMPYMFGWHPAFALDEIAPIKSYSVDFGNECTVMNFPGFSVQGTEYLIKDGKVPMGDALLVEHRVIAFKGAPTSASVVSPGTKRRVDMSWGDNLNYTCLWRLDEDDCNYICIEPWTQLPGDRTTPADFETKDMERLEAGSDRTYSYSVTFN